MEHAEGGFGRDVAKSEVNLDKRGVDFSTARQIWAGFYLPVSVKRVFLRELPDGRTVKERRWKAVGTIQGELWTALYTLRNGRVRIISCRQATNRERSEYDRRLYG